MIYGRAKQPSKLRVVGSNPAGITDIKIVLKH